MLIYGYALMAITGSDNIEAHSGRNGCDGINFEFALRFTHSDTSRVIDSSPRVRFAVLPPCYE